MIAGQRAQAEGACERTREVTLDPEPLRTLRPEDQGPGGSLPGPDAGHPLHGARGHRAASSGKRQPSCRASPDGCKPPGGIGDSTSAPGLAPTRRTQARTTGPSRCPRPGTNRHLNPDTTRRTLREATDRRRYRQPTPGQPPGPGKQVIEPVTLFVDESAEDLFSADPLLGEGSISGGRA